MLIGIISDSHDNIDNIKKAVKIFQNKKTDLVLHLGDYINPGAVKVLEGLKIIGIFGNNDGDKFRLINAFNQIKGEIKGDFYEFEQDNLKIALYHGTESQIKDALINCNKYDVVLYGHTHIKENKIVGKTLIINPGTSHGFGNEATIATFNSKNKKVEFIEL